ncbi:MAG: hypothetical protein EOO04_22065 [Chitinophagaceae bacterium]|nr:MAG: hypothetical protein EOO04_22065 [Chitinophagaceae bacterium]
MMELRANLNKETEILRAAFSRLREQKSASDQTRSAISTLGRLNPGYRSMSISIDTLNNQWIGIYDEHELHELLPHIYIRRANDETARRFLVMGQISYDKNNQPKLDLSTFESFRNGEFLDGGLLLNKATGLPFRLADNRYLIVHKDVIGKDGKIKISAITNTGQLLWTAETALKSWYDWQLHKNKLVVFGQDNRELMGDDANALLIIDIATGKISRYDYFTDRD